MENALNDFITTVLASRGWIAETEEDYDRLNDLTLEAAGLIEAFDTSR